MGTEDQRRYGWCKRTGAWVLRDEMLGMHIQIFDAAGEVERVTIRLHPEAHRILADELRALGWENVLRTRAELVAESAPIAEVLSGATDTAAWYDTRRAAEDERMVARALLRPALRARSMEGLEVALRYAADRVGGEVLYNATQETLARLPRWDAEIVSLAEYNGGGNLYMDLAVSADEAEVLVLRVSGHDKKAEIVRVDHDRGEAIMRSRGLLRDGSEAIGS